MKTKRRAMKAAFAFFLIFSAAAACGGAASAGSDNPIFGPDESAAGLYLGQGTGNRHPSLAHLIYPGMWDIRPMSMGMVQYSVPIEIFGLHGRQNAHLVFNGGYGTGADLSFMAAGLSWDVVFFMRGGFYAGFGIGPYYKSSIDRYVSSRLVAGPKFFVGGRASDHWRVEFFTLHFSNGNLTPVNSGFNFAGLAAIRSF